MAKKQDPIQQNLILAYNRAVEDRDNSEVQSWKLAERESFLQMLRDEEKSHLVDIGSGPGTHAVFFQEHGIKVTCVDLSSRNISRCREKGLDAWVCDVKDLGRLGEEFEAAFAMNSLLHVPRRDLSGVLVAIHDVLVSGGLFYWGQYGGKESEGVYEEDGYSPKRFFSLLDDEQIARAASGVFQVERLGSVELEGESTIHYQSMILRVKN